MKLFSPAPVSAVNGILHDYQHIVESTSLNHGSKGIFDVVVDGEMLYSKHETGRHAEEGEVARLFEEKYGEGVTKYAHS